MKAASESETVTTVCSREVVVCFPADTTRRFGAFTLPGLQTRFPRLFFVAQQM
jgi:hypothetical protein